MLFPTELCACIGHISYFRDREPRTSTSTFTVLRPQRSWTIRDGEPRTATSTFTQIYVHGDHGLLGTGRPGHPPQLSHRFTSTEIMDYWGRGAQDIHLNFHTDLRPRRSWTIGDGEPRTSTTTFIHPLSSNVNRFPCGPRICAAEAAGDFPSARSTFCADLFRDSIRCTPVLPQ